MTPKKDSVYEYKTQYQQDVERFSAEVISNSRKIKRSEQPDPKQYKKDEKHRKTSLFIAGE
jgi:hypothetical protein